METAIITAVITVVTSTVSSLVTWILARRKYNAEVDNQVITGMKESLDFYHKLSDDNTARLEDLLKRNDMLEKQVNTLRGQVLMLSRYVCMDLGCTIRKQNKLLKDYEDNFEKNSQEEGIHDWQDVH